MQYQNRKALRDSLVGKKIDDVLFHDSHGLVLEIVLDNGEKLAVCTYEDDRGKFGNFFVGFNNIEL